MTMDRDNERWLRELRVAQEAAVADLRGALLRNLRSALGGTAKVDEGFLEDITQEAVLKILSKLAQFQGRSKFLTWATTIAIRHAFGQLRQRRWRDVSLDDVLSDIDFAAHRVVDTLAPPDVLAQRSGLLDALELAIHRDLTERQRTALLAELKGMPQDEIAHRLNSNRNAIYKLTHDARKKLKTALESAGYTADDVVTISFA